MRIILARLACVLATLALLLATVLPPTTFDPPTSAQAAVASLPASLTNATVHSPTNLIAQAHLDQTFGQMPLYFVENQGQLDPQVAYTIQASNKIIYFTAEGVTFALTEQLPTTDYQPLTADHRLPFHAMPDLHFETRRWIVKLDFVGANPNVRPVGQDRTDAIISYFKGSPDQWRTGLPTYSRIVYSDLWPGIDLVYYGTVNQLKYEFIVRPGADPAQIRLAYRGATDLTLNAVGQLQISTPLGGFSDDAPVAYQDIDGRRAPVEMAYQLLPAAGTDGEQAAFEGATFNLQPVTFKFALGDYDPTRPLILDPAVLIYCGYIGGAGGDVGYAIAIDATSNVYITGDTESSETSFPVTVGPDPTYNGGSYDAFVVKINRAGTSLVYASYIGGSYRDEGASIAVDIAGNAYITGQTESNEDSFPVNVGPDLTYNGSGDAFVVKVNPFGTSLVYAGYIGGSGQEYSYGIAVDAFGNAYIAGKTHSPEDNFPVTVGPDLTHNGIWDAFVAKVNPSGENLVYAGYIGGFNDDRGFAIAVDATGSAYVTGDTYSTEDTFPVIGGPDLTHNSDANDAFVAKVKPSGDSLVYAGYIGGSGTNYGFGIAVDATGSAYVTGGTGSFEDTFPVTGGPDLTFNGNLDVFIAKVAPSGNNLVYAGYIGGSGDELGSGIALDAAGNAYVTGVTLSTEDSFPVSGGPDLTFNGDSHDQDAFVARVNPLGTGLVYAGYIGGLGRDGGKDITVDAAGNAYVTGYTLSNENTFPVLTGPDLTHNGGFDAFVARIALVTPITRSIGGAGTYILGDTCAQLTFSPGQTGALTAITITLIPALPVASTLGKPLPRQYDISGDGGGFTATLSVCYTDADLIAADVVTESDLQLHRYEGNSQWRPYTSTVNTSANIITTTGVITFGLWAISTPAGSDRLLYLPLALRNK